MAAKFGDYDTWCKCVTNRAAAYTSGMWEFCVKSAACGDRCLHKWCCGNCKCSLEQQWQQGLRFWNSLAQLPEDNLYKTIAKDDLTAANQQCGMRNWAAGLLVIVRRCDLRLTDAVGNLQAVDQQKVLESYAAEAFKVRENLAKQNPRSFPSDGVKECTYQAWFGRPAWAKGPHFWQLSLSAPQRRAILRLRLGSHELAVETGRQKMPPLPRHQRLCVACSANVVGDEQHLLMECSATADVRSQFADLFVQPHLAMHQLMWHHDRNRVVASC